MSNSPGNFAKKMTNSPGVCQIRLVNSPKIDKFAQEIDKIAWSISVLLGQIRLFQKIGRFTPKTDIFTLYEQTKLKPSKSQKTHFLVVFLRNFCRFDVFKSKSLIKIQTFWYGDQKFRIFIWEDLRTWYTKPHFLCLNLFHLYQ